jgi:hypothetical protein
MLEVMLSNRFKGRNRNRERILVPQILYRFPTWVCSTAPDTALVLTRMPLSQYSNNRVAIFIHGTAPMVTVAA